MGLCPGLSHVQPAFTMKQHDLRSIAGEIVTNMQFGSAVSQAKESRFDAIVSDVLRSLSVRSSVQDNRTSRSTMAITDFHGSEQEVGIRLRNTADVV